MTDYVDDPRVNRALNELSDIVRSAHPEATFEVASAADDADIVQLFARVDVDDPDEVADLVMDRMLEMQLEEGLPVYLIPLRTPERIAILREAQRRQLSAESAYFPAVASSASSSR
jgi:hypothetical protein